MMKTFNTPAIDVLKFEVADVITTSAPVLGDNETEEDRD